MAMKNFPVPVPVPVSDPNGAYEGALGVFQAGDWAGGERLCRGILRAWPEFAAVHQLLALCLGRLGRECEGLLHQRQAVFLRPEDAQFRYNLAVCLAEAGLEAEAAQQYRACLRLLPSHADALWNYGEMLRLSEYFDLAAACFERLLAAGLSYPGLHHRLGVCRGAMGDLAGARRCFALGRVDAGLSPAQRALSSWEEALLGLAHAGSGAEFAAGWAWYERRFDCEGGNQVGRFDYGLPWWDGCGLGGGHLLVHGEQGLGDELMFASLVPLLLARARGAGSRVVLAVKPALVRLFALGFPEAVVLAQGGSAEPADLRGALLLGVERLDWQCSLGSLPHVLGCWPGGDSGAGGGFSALPYLRADAERTAFYAARLLALRPGSGVECRVGLMWGSAPNRHIARHASWAQRRSIAVALLERLADVPGVCFVSLQNAERGAEAALAPRLDIVDLSEEQTDFFETAALAANLDLVISVDTSMGHLAGAMGLPTWQPLMQRADWRHGQADGATGVRSHWYADVHYFRQAEPDEWAPVVARLRDRLRVFAAHNVAGKLAGKLAGDGGAASLSGLGLPSVQS